MPQGGDGGGHLPAVAEDQGDGRLTPDLGLLEETVDYIRALCDIVVEISTGGVSEL